MAITVGTPLSPHATRVLLVGADELGREVAIEGQGRVIVEGFVDFDYEITLRTVRHSGGLLFCDPIGHIQESGDFRETWQPADTLGIVA